MTPNEKQAMRSVANELASAVIKTFNGCNLLVHENPNKTYLKCTIYNACMEAFEAGVKFSKENK